MLKITSPTGFGIRSDNKGDGHYGARRGIRRHLGLDFKLDLSKDKLIYCPIDNGIITKEVYPYADLSYNGLEIRNKDITLRLYYCKVLNGLVRQTVFKGQIIASAEDVSLKHGFGMIPHVHLEITSINPEMFLNVEMAKKSI